MNEMKTTQQETDDLETSSAPPDVIQDPLTVPFKPVRTELESGKPPDPNQPDQTTENPLTMGLQSVMRGMSQTTDEPTTGGSKPRFAVSGTETNIELEQGTGKGSGLVVNAMDTGEFAHDGVSMTTRYLNELEQSPDLSEEELWRRAVKNDANKSGQLTTVQEAPLAPPMVDESMIHPTDGNSIYKLDPNLMEQHSTRRAIVIGNKDYTEPGWSNLPGAERDAGAMAGRYRSLGYDVTHLKDQTSSGLLKAAFGAGDGLYAGDSLVFYYAGHGVERGLVGTNSSVFESKMKVLGYTILNSLITDAVSGDYHASVITDACESGSMSDKLKKEYEDETTSSSSESMFIDFDHVNDEGYSKFDGKGERTGQYDDQSVEDFYDKRFGR